MEKDNLKKDQLSRKTYSNGFYQLIALSKTKHHRVQNKIQNNVNKICRFQAFFK